jgi:NADH-quinone oxidoreductase subunit N
MNIGAFAVIGAISDAGLGEELSDYRGLGQRAPSAALAMSLFLFSLTGLPPFAGFFGKYFLFAALIAKGGTLLVTTAVIGVLNSAVSLFYYAKVLKAMYFQEPAEGADAPVKIRGLHEGIIWAMAIPSLLMFVAWSPVMHFVDVSLGQWMPQVIANVTASLP